MKPYAELLEFNQPNPIRRTGFTRIRDQFPELIQSRASKQFRFHDPELITEFAGRWDYGAKNAAKLGQPSRDGKKLIQKWIASGEQSMLEMGHATFFIECSRVVSHELVRHRLASFQQESQRFTKYDDIDQFDEVQLDDMMYMPEMGPGPVGGAGYTWTANAHYREKVRSDLGFYKMLREHGVPPQIARYMLPNATRTRMIVSANLREWRHIIKLRLHPSAQPEMRELMQQIYDQLVEVFPQSLEGVLEEGRGVR